MSVQVERREALLLEAVQETLNLLRGALQIAYPANHGLPCWEPARLLLEDKETTGGQDISQVLKRKQMQKRSLQNAFRKAFGAIAVAAVPAEMQNKAQYGWACPFGSD